MRCTANHPLPARGNAARRAAFTLIELVLVMALLVVVIAVGAPSLARFFRGRTLDSESRRFVAVTRAAQSRAISESMPTVLWIDSDQNAYGVLQEGTDQSQDPKFIYCELGKDLKVQVTAAASSTSQTKSKTAGNKPYIRFTPDGLMADTNPQYIIFSQRDEDSVYIGLDRTGLHYEIQTNNVPNLARR